MGFINKILAQFGYVKKDDFIEQLHYARSVSKRLDEHRETVYDLEKSGFLTKDCWWRTNHLATQDDYLMRLYYIVYGFYPENIPQGYAKIKAPPNVRPRPKILGQCGLPEYKYQQTK